MLPPKMSFISEMWHPNVHTNGDVCISILHAPGEDTYGYESARFDCQSVIYNNSLDRFDSSIVSL